MGFIQRWEEQSCLFLITEPYCDFISAGKLVRIRLSGCNPMHTYQAASPLNSMELASDMPSSFSNGGGMGWFGGKTLLLWSQHQSILKYYSDHEQEGSLLTCWEGSRACSFMWYPTIHVGRVGQISVPNWWKLSASSELETLIQASPHALCDWEPPFQGSCLCSRNHGWILLCTQSCLT